MNAISGSLRIDTAAGAIDSHNDPLGGKRWDGTACKVGQICPFNLNQIGGVTAGNADGASRDFFLSVLKQAVQFPTLNTAVGAPDVAQAGIWLNWRDRLSAINTTGTLPPNAGKGP
jgi:hypothetical protein